VLGLSLVKEYTENKMEIYTWITSGLGVAIAAISVSLITRFLQKGQVESSLTRKELERLKEELKLSFEHRSGSGVEVNDFVKNLHKEVIQLKKDISPITEEEKEGLIASIKSDITTSATGGVLDEMREKLKSDLENNRNRSLLAKHFDNTTSRLREELYSLTKRSNLNLALGIVTTLVGLSLLGMFVLQAPLQFDTTIDFAESFLPRLSLVILIEIFAYFFLRLYKDTLAEIKYFQNEITNIEAKHLATEIAIENKVEGGVLQIIEGLLATERNHILNKGQTTVEIEKARTERQLTDSIVTKITSLVGNNPNK
jgi:uncharacterized membrane-anchored protein YhcB (DUF1043 family)